MESVVDRIRRWARDEPAGRGCTLRRRDPSRRPRHFGFTAPVGSAGRVVLAVPLRHRPLHHGSNPPEYHPRRHAFSVPEVVGEQHAHDIGGRDLVDGVPKNPQSMAPRLG